MKTSIRSARVAAFLSLVSWMCGISHAEVTTTWNGGTGLWSDPGQWSDGVPGDDDTAVIDVGEVVLAEPTAALAALTLNGGTLTFSNWTTRLNATTVTLNSGSLTCAGPFNSYTNVVWPTFEGSNRVAISCSNLTVASGAAIDVDERGYRGGHYVSPTYYDGHGPGGGGNYIGGTHATSGGRSTMAPYGDYLRPMIPGSGGGPDYKSNGGKPGHGGGAVEILATGTVTVDGTITADGATDMVNSWGAGAGGSIYIECRLLAGSGSVSAEGGRSAGGGSGSGGRISAQYDPVAQAAVPQPSITFSANSLLSVARVYNHGNNSRIGTLCFPDNRLLTSPLVHDGVWVATNPPLTMAFSSLEANNVWFQLANEGVILTVTNDLIIDNTARLELTDAVVSCGSLTVTNFGIFDLYSGGTASPSLAVQGGAVMADDSYLKIFSGPTNAVQEYGSWVSVNGTFDISDNAWAFSISDPTNGGSVKVTCRNITIGAGAGFDANAVGFCNVAGVPYGPGKATGTWGGGGYGGAGGGANGGPTYGTSNAVPLQCGSAGGGSATYGSGHGGGLTWLAVLDRIILDGTLVANGGNGGSYGSGGSGGGIYVEANRFGGSGFITADGGLGGSKHSSTGGGGGGRIHVSRVKDLGNTVTTSVLGLGRVGALTSNTGEVGTVVWTWLPPVDADIEMRPATGVTTTSAHLNAYLVTTGASVTVVSVYWGETNGEADAAAWANTNVLAGVAEPGVVTETVALDPGHEYYYRCSASNAAGVVWAEEDSEYLLSDGITITFSLTAVSEAGAVATATVSRAASVMSEPITVYYTISGMAVNGSDYTTIDTNVTILAGASNAVVTLTTIPDALSPNDKSLILTLDPGRNYALGTPSAATLMIENEGIAATNISVSDGDWHDTATWSEGHVPVNPQEVVITNQVRLTANTEQLTSLTLEGGGSLTFANWETVLFASNVWINAGTLTCEGPFNSYVNDIWPTLDPSNRVRIVCEALSIAPGASVNVDGKGFRAGHYADSTYYSGHGPGGGGTYIGGTHAASGGRGAKAPYGDYLHPATPGSGGGPDYKSDGGKPGHGGGVVEILATGTVTVDGAITADGATDMVNSWGAGAGGSIYIECRLLAGGGSVSAEGGRATGGGSGSGGRISVQYDPVAQASASQPSITFSASSLLSVARVYSHGNNSRIGTLCFPDNRLLKSPLVHNGVWIATNPPLTMAFSSLEANNVWFQLANEGVILTVTNQLIIDSAARLELTNAVVSCGSLTVTNFGIFDLYSGGTGSPSLAVQGDTVMADDSYLKIFSGATNAVQEYGSWVSVNGTLDISDNAWVFPISHPTNGGSVKVTCRNVTIGAGAGFDANAVGFCNVAGVPFGPGKATGTWGGGGYGGAGGGANGGPAYGTSNAVPLQCGSAGGGSTDYLGGTGGGLTWLVVLDRIILDGTLTANGGNSDKYGSGGSGGGIYVQANRFGGSGFITADGGLGGSSHTSTGGGGGGRIHVSLVQDLGNTVTTSVLGMGRVGALTSNTGEAGTIVWSWRPPTGTMFLLR